MVNKGYTIHCIVMHCLKLCSHLDIGEYSIVVFMRNHSSVLAQGNDEFL